MTKYECTVCGYAESMDNMPSDFVCPICGAKKESFIVKSEDIIESDINAVIESVVEDSLNENERKIINNVLEEKRIRIDEYNPSIIRINEKCLNCGQCKKTCEKIVNISYDLNACKNPICIGCGQCILNCPSGALQPKYAYQDVKEIINANEKIVVALVSPAVRVSLGDHFGIEPGTNVEGKLVTSLKKIGFDYVFDTAFGADLTVMEEVVEFAQRLSNKETLPQFTSCCPAWVKYAEIYHPEIITNISSCKSPIGMQCAIIKSYFCEKKGFDSSKIVTVAITPCTAKKMEAKEYTNNIDFVLTASEVSLMLKEEEVNLSQLQDSEFDKLLGEGSGAGIIFGATGGVCESVIRTLSRIMNKADLKKDELVFESVRGLNGIKEANIVIAGRALRVAIVHQMSNLEELLKDNRYKKYHFIEVMNCKGGCAGGGGQPLNPITQNAEILEKRINGLYNVDKKRVLRVAHNNKEIKQLYKEFLKKPMSEVSLKLLHTSYSDKSNLLSDKNN